MFLWTSCARDRRNSLLHVRSWNYFVLDQPLW